MPGRSSSATRRHKVAGCATRRDGRLGGRQADGEGSGRVRTVVPGRKDAPQLTIATTRCPHPPVFSKAGVSQIDLPLLWCFEADGEDCDRGRASIGPKSPFLVRGLLRGIGSCLSHYNKCGLPSCPPHDGGYRRRLPGLQPCLAGAGAHDLLARSGLRGRPLHASNRVRLLSPR